MHTIFLYPGQGSQIVGMGRDLADRFSHVRQRYVEASEILGFDLARICFEGPEEELRQTRVTQPALFVHSCVLTELLEGCGITPAAVAGHSLGEYSALFAAKAFSFGEGVKLVKARSEAMQLAGTQNPGTMAAIVGLDDEVVRQLCAEQPGIVVPANYNAPGQLVVSGEVESVHSAMAAAKARGARLVKELSVSGAFHSPLMRSAADSLALALQDAHVSDSLIPVISNVTAKRHGDAPATRRLLAEQLLSPVRWTDSMIELAARGEVRWYEVGSGSVLAGLLKRTVKGSVVVPVGTSAELDLVTEISSKTDG